MFELKTLGSIDLTSSDRGSIKTLLAQPKRLALLVYLLVDAPGAFVSRDTLLSMFWPDADETRARASLRQALQFLRRTVGDTAVLTRGDNEVGIDHTVVACDAVALRAALKTDADTTVLDRYTGHFMPGFVVDETPEFERWLSTTRHTLQQEVATAAGKMADEIAHSSLSNAVEHARRAVALAPFDEHATRRLATMLDRGGDRAGALRELDALRVRLDQELGVQLSPETLEFDRVLRSRTTVRSVAASDGEASPASLAPPLGANPDNSAVASAAKSADAGESSTTTPTARSHASRWFAVASIGVFALVIWFAVSQWRSAPATQSPTRTDTDTRPRILVAPFVNQTGDSAWSALGAMTADWITEGLSRVEGLRIVPLTAMTSATRAQGVVVVSDTAAALTRLARELGATVLVSGAAYRTGGTLHLQAHVVDIASGALLGRAETVSVPADSVMAGIDRLRTRIVATLAPLGDTVSHLRRAIAPPSYQAYRDYIAGLEAFVQGDAQRALRYFEQSAAIDTAYPIPRIASSIMLMNLDRPDSASNIVTALADRRQQLGPLERATLDMVEGILRSDLAMVERAAQEQARIAPGTIGHYMVAEISRRRGKPREAIGVLRMLGPEKGELRGWRPYWRELTASLHMVGDHEAELVVAQDALRLYPNDPTVHGYVVRALAALGRRALVDSALTARDVSRTNATDGAETLYHIAANGFAARGDSSVAHGYRRREEMLLAQQVGTLRTLSVRWRHARALLLNEKVDAARDTLRALVSMSPTTMDVLGLAAVAAARAGDTADTDRMLVRMNRLDAARTAPVRNVAEADVLYWQAVIAAQRRDARGATALLQRAHASGRSQGAALHSDPWFAPVRSSVEFSALLRTDR